MTARDAGYDEWVDALADGRGYALVCPEGHGSLPPRRTCPECGATTFSEEPLPERGTVETVTVVHVPPPQFADDAPYATAIAAFGPVRLTGVLRGVDVGEKELSGDGDDDDDTAGDAATASDADTADDDPIAIGAPVEVGVAARDTDERRVVTLRPATE
ncbi:MAG: putative nucleic-acid-binding protein containing a Zn-ribbon [uncultured archaeon A07HR67]|nr:MAG: putative nucleic-acid-binding protein containing a Zn-ribbon [uncultured archaeon A07HR67]